MVYHIPPLLNVLKKKRYNRIIIMTYAKQLLITLSHIIKGYFYTLYWYPRIDRGHSNIVVAVVDGRLYTGGMTDRFIGIISLYAWAKSMNLPFRIRYISPFNLSDYLLPNKYDWTLRGDEYVESSLVSKVVYAVGEHRVDLRLDRIAGTRQIHFYGNRDLLNYPRYREFDWGKLYKELFRPTNKLQGKINKLRNSIGNNYFSIVYRFQNLLGDFEEYDFKSLSSVRERNAYINICVQELLRLQEKEGMMPCLVTSDSLHFLDRIKDIPNVHIIPGSLVHMGSNRNGTYEQYEKSFLDFYMLAGSTKIYNVVYNDMYPSGFPLYASKLNSIPFERIILKQEYA